MTIDLYTMTGTKKGTLDLPESLFGAPINMGLMHQAVVLQQSNRRNAIAHVKRRSEVAGSTKKLYQQKHTGRARRGSVRSPLLRGGGKSFGPRKDQNFSRAMPRNMRRRALISALSAQAAAKSILGLEGYPDAIKTKQAHQLLGKLPVELGRRILIVAPSAHRGLQLSVRNLPNVHAITAAYLNPEDVLAAHRIVFLVDALKVAESTFARKNPRVERAAKEEGGTQSNEKIQKIQKTQRTQKTPKSKVSS